MIGGRLPINGGLLVGGSLLVGGAHVDTRILNMKLILPLALKICDHNEAAKKLFALDTRKKSQFNCYEARQCVDYPLPHSVYKNVKLF